MLLAFADLRGATLVHYIAASGMDHLISLLLAPLDAAQARCIVESEGVHPVGCCADVRRLLMAWDAAMTRVDNA